MRDPETGNSRGFGFISYDSFETSDSAIEAMNGQYLCNRQISVSYAYKKDTKGERHGTPAERVLAASNPVQKNRPHTLFASGPPTLPSGSHSNVMPMPPRPFANGAVSLAHMPPVRPPQTGAFPPPMHMGGPPSWPGHPQQPGQGFPPPSMPPPPLQQFRAPMRPPPNMPPPPQGMIRPPPPPAGMGMPPPTWRPMPPPQQGGMMAPMPPPPMSMPPPPSTNMPQRLQPTST